MASSIHKYMDDLTSLMEFMPSPINDKVNYFMKALGTFLFCVTKLRKNSDGAMEDSLTSLLVRIDQVFRRNAQIFELYCREGYHGAVLVDFIHRFEADMKQFEVEVDRLYEGLSDSLHLWTIGDAMDVIDSVVKNLDTFHGLNHCEMGGAAEALEERLRLFTSFVGFVAVQGAENQEFVIHVTSVAFGAAFVTAQLSCLFDAPENRHGWKRIESKILALLQKMKPVDFSVSEAWKTALAASKYSITLNHTVVVKGFIDFLLCCLWEALEMDSLLNDSTKAQVQPLWEGLKSLRAIHTEHPHKYDEDVFKSVICDAGIIIFSLHHQDYYYTDLGMLDLLKKFDMIRVEVEDHNPVECSPVDSDAFRAGIHTSMDLDQSVGLDEDTEYIVQQLTRRARHLRIISIVGMAGMGKTTLALKVYNHPSVTDHFQNRAWCSVSQVYTTRKLLLELLNQIHPSGRDHEMDEDDMANELRKSLKGRRYFLILDDVWDIEAWNILRSSLPDDLNGSRILLTSRDGSATSLIDVSVDLHFLQLLTDGQSWELLQKKLFPTGNCPLKLYQLGKQIAIACGGLPLTVVIVAGLLTTPKPDAWKEVLLSINSGVISRSNQMVHALELSYNHLPQYLRPCFLYTAFFPEDEEISLKLLIWLMIAEGFVLKKKNQKVEDVAKEYILDLAGKSLVIVANRSSTGEAKALRVHESVREFCINKAKVENLSEIIKGYEEILGFQKLCDLPRLFIQSSRRNFKSLRLSRRNIHSLLFMARDEACSNVVDDISFITLVFKTLRVLHIRQVDLGDVFPNEMELLVELRYLCVGGNLSNLQTLIVDSNHEVSMPGSIWDLHKLRHLCINNGFRFPIDNFSRSLYEIQSCSTVIIESNTSEKLLRKLPNVRKLKYRLMKSTSAILIPECLGELESLHVSMIGRSHGVHCKFQFHVPPNLRKLTLEGFELPQTVISAIAKLPNLESLKMLRVDFRGAAFHVEKKGDFPKLRFLKLTDSNIARWTVAEACFSWKLETLILQGCMCFEEIPCKFMEWLVTLKAIEVLNCSASVERQLKEIHETQTDLGNYVKINISSTSSIGTTRRDLQ